MNHLLIVLDSVSYDIFSQADAKNIRNLGKVEEAYSPGMWTLPTVMSVFHSPYFMGKPVIGFGKHEPHVWIPSLMKKHNYINTLVSDNPWFTVYKDLFGRGFDNYIVKDTVKDLGQFDAEWVIENGSKHLIGNFFTVLWITSTHHGEKLKIAFKQTQIDAIEKVDSCLGNLIPKVPKGTEIVVTADHGDAYNGDIILGHYPRDVTDFDERLFKVFYVRKVT